MNVLAALITIGAFLVVAGLFTLIYAIPRWTPKGDLKTEVLSGRAALWCVAVGLAVIFIGVVETSIKDIILRKP
jgi:uncharacterized membrane protein YidH (DUF202 family)